MRALFVPVLLALALGLAFWALGAALHIPGQVGAGSVAALLLAVLASGAGAWITLKQS